MPTHTLLRECLLPDDELHRELDAVFGPTGDDWLLPDVQPFYENRPVTGRVVEVGDDAVRVDVGFKSDGFIPLREWSDENEIIPPPRPGDSLEVMLLSVEGEDGLVLSYRKARQEAAWARFVEAHKVGDEVVGRVFRRISGGLLINVGVTAFLPASQVDVRRPLDLNAYVGRDLACLIIALDRNQRSVVVSRRELLYRQHVCTRGDVLTGLEIGQVRKGIVKNIAEFGAFVDLGGIDGLLHVSDKSWGRINNPRDVVHLDQLIEVYVLSVDKDKEKIALSLKHKTPSPWVNAAEKYPVGSRHKGEAVNLMSYGAFVRLEPGIEGLVHISEMSWTRLGHPSEAVRVGDAIEVQVLNVHVEKGEISLGMKQLTPNPWDELASRYQPNTIVTAVVRALTTWGAFVVTQDGLEGLIHVNDMGWGRRRGQPGDLLRKGDEVTCVVLSIDVPRHRLGLGLKQLMDDPWQGDVPGRYKAGEVKKGKVTNVANFGVFVELEPGVEGLLHVSEMAGTPEGSASGDEIEVEILRVDVGERKIGLSRKRLG